jgi:hypothetical protein
MTAYRFTENCSKEIEQKLREHGSVLVTQEWNCWVQFYYQQLESVEMNSLNCDIPAFTAVGVDKREFMICECNDTITPVENLSVPTVTTNITEIDTRVFDKMNVFNLIKKSVKRIRYVFKHFQFDDVHVLLSENMLILEGPEAHVKLCTLLPLKIVSSLKSLSINSGFVRPNFKTIDESTKVAFWVYQLAKQTERVFPPEDHPRQVEFKDCLFAKDFLVV